MSLIAISWAIAPVKNDYLTGSDYSYVIRLLERFNYLTISNHIGIIYKIAWRGESQTFPFSPGIEVSAKFLPELGYIVSNRFICG